MLLHLLICELAGMPGANVAFEVRLLLLVITLIFDPPVLIPPIQVLVQATGSRSSSVVYQPQHYLIVLPTTISV